MSAALNGLKISGRVNLGSISNPVDPNFDDVSLLLHGDTSFIDSSPRTKTVSPGTAVINNSIFKFGGGSMRVGNSTTAVPDVSSSEFAFGTNNFTVEGFIYRTVDSVSTLGCISSFITVGGLNPTQLGFIIGLTNNVPFFGVGANWSNGQPNNIVSHNSSIPLNTWIHVAGVRNDNILRIYVDGISVNSVATTISITNQTATLGRHYVGSTGFRFNGYIDELRITRNVARYTSNFTPPDAPFLNS